MSVVHKPIMRGVREWTGDPESKEFIWDSSVYANSSRSITNEPLDFEDGATLIFEFSGYSLSLDYRFDLEDGGPYGEDTLAGLMVYNADDPTIYNTMAIVFFDGMATDGWENASIDLEAWRIECENEHDITLGRRWICTAGVYWGDEPGKTPPQLWLDNIEITPVLALSAGMGAPEQTVIPTSAWALEAHPPVGGFVTSIPVSAWAFSMPPVPFGPTHADIPVSAWRFVGRASRGFWNIPLDELVGSSVIYTLTLTGASDGLDDVVIPMASFQARMRTGTPSYLSCSIPNSAAWADEVTARPNGRLIVKKGLRLRDGREQLEPIAEGDFSHLMLDRGGRSDSMAVVGYRTIPTSTPSDREAKKASYYAITAEGKRRVRCDIDLFLRPGDNLIYAPGETFKVGLISYQVRAYPAYAIMEATEE